MKSELKGVFTFLVTPFNLDNVMELNEEGLRGNIKYLRKSGIQVLVPCGETGEIYSLTPEENKRIIEIVAEEKGSTVLIPGVPPGIKIAVGVAKHAEEVGADAVLVFAPQTVTSEEGLYNYYKEVADSVEIGIMPYIQGGLALTVNRNPNFIKRLVEIENIVAFKYESSDLWTLGKLMRLSEAKVSWICGPNFSAEVTECYFRLGVSGFADGISNFAPQLPLALYKAAINEKWEEFKRMEKQMAEITKMRSKAGSTALLKLALDMIGSAGGQVRPPRVNITDEGREHLKKEMQKLGVQFRKT